MDGVQAAVEIVTAHISNPKHKERIRASLFSLLKDLQDQQDILEGNSYYKNDASDGIPIVTLEEIKKRDEEKYTKLGLFSKQECKKYCVEGCEYVHSENLDEIGKYGYTALHRAVFAEDYEAVKYLLKHKARYDIEDFGGYTARESAEFRKDDSQDAARIAVLFQTRRKRKP